MLSEKCPDIFKNAPENLRLVDETHPSPSETPVKELEPLKGVAGGITEEPRIGAEDGYLRPLTVGTPQTRADGLFLKMSYRFRS